MKEIPKDYEREKKADIVSTVYEADESKALTGRTPERIEEETGVPKEEMFPNEKKILYVGDPWQRMGKEIDSSNFTLIDYEFGEVARFESDDWQLRRELPYGKEKLDERAEGLSLPSLSEEIKNWLDGFWKSYDSAYKLTEETKNWEDFLVVSDAWEDTRLLVDTERDRAKDLQYDHFIGEYELFLTDAWYVCTRSEKGFRDVYDFNTEILPKLEKFREECKRQNMDDGEMEEKIEREKIKLIEEIRLVKKPKNANVVKAIFPELPFKDDSFDRFVASWSISAHTFSHLEKNEFDIVWKEIGRVMKEGGSAYVFPLSYSYIDKDIFLSSLKDMEKECEGMRYVFLNSYGEGIEYDDGANTLLLYKEKSQEKGGDDGSYYATAVNHIKSKLMSKSASQEDAKGLSRRPRVRRRGRSRLEKEDKI